MILLIISIYFHVAWLTDRLTGFTFRAEIALKLEQQNGGIDVERCWFSVCRGSTAPCQGRMRGELRH